MREKRLLILATALVALVVPASTGAAVQLRGVETSSYPTIRASVVSTAGARVVPVFSENGSAVAGLQLQNLGSAKAIVLAVDRSQSMRGKPLADASLGARSFVAAKDSFSNTIAFTVRWSTMPFILLNSSSSLPLSIVGSSSRL